MTDMSREDVGKLRDIFRDEIKSIADRIDVGQSGDHFLQYCRREVEELERKIESGKPEVKS